MKKYLVSMTMTVIVSTEIKAESAEEAEKKALLLNPVNDAESFTHCLIPDKEATEVEVTEVVEPSAHQTRLFLGIALPSEKWNFSGSYAHLGYRNGNLLYSKLEYVKTDEEGNEYYNSCIGVVVYSKYKGWG